MKEAGLLSVTNSTLFVTLTVEQVREVFRQEILSVMNTKNGSQSETATPIDAVADRPYLTIPEAAKIATVAASTIWLYVRRGNLKAERVGKRRMIARAELDRFLRSGAA